LGADPDGQAVAPARFSGCDDRSANRRPQVNVEIDRDKAAALGVTAQQIENGLYDAYGERQASTIYADVAEYWVVFEVLPQFQLDPDRARATLHHQFRDRHQRRAQTHSLERRRKIDAHRRPDKHFARRPVAVGDHFLQPRAWHVARHGRRTIAKN
jgi:hypothetical protein